MLPKQIFILDILHPVPMEIWYITAQCEKTIDGKFSLLLLEVKVRKTVLNTGYNTTGATYCSAATQFGRKLPPPLLSTVFQHVLKYNKIFTYFLYVYVQT